tara:strand:+ start:514 stop:1995 length:1482 start_codon:yes stop_codon:yes gene_type:complete
MFALCNPPYLKKNRVVLKDHGGGIGYAKQGDKFKARKTPILDLLYGYQIIKKMGLDTIIADDQHMPSENFEDFIIKYPEIINSKTIFIRFSQPTIDNDLNFAHFLKKKNYKAKLVAFGPAIENNKKWFFEDNIFDYLITSEFEAVIESFINKTKDNHENIDVEISGIFSKINKKYVCADTQTIKADLQSLPNLPYHLEIFKDYTKFAISSRGCPIGCTYCPYILVQNKKFRFKTAEQVIDELTYYQNLGVETIIFRDPNFGYNQQRVRDICELYIQKKLKIEWECETVLNTLKDETIVLMCKANCKLVRVGIETVSPELLKLAKRPSKLADIQVAKNKIDLFQKNKCKVYGFFVIGFEGDNLKSIKTAPKVAKFLNLDKAQFMTPNLYPGIEQYQKFIDEKKLDKNILSNRELYSEIIGTHAKINFSLAENIDTTTLHIGKKYCERMWNLYNKNEKLPLKQFIKYFVFTNVAKLLLNNFRILNKFRIAISENN